MLLCKYPHQSKWLHARWRCSSQYHHPLTHYYSLGASTIKHLFTNASEILREKEKRKKRQCRELVQRALVFHCYGAEEGNGKSKRAINCNHIEICKACNVDFFEQNNNPMRWSTTQKTWISNPNRFQERRSAWIWCTEPSPYSLLGTSSACHLPVRRACTYRRSTRSKKKQRKKQQQLWGFGNFWLLIYKRKAIGIPILKSREYA